MNQEHALNILNHIKITYGLLKTEQNEEEKYNLAMQFLIDFEELLLLEKDQLIISHAEINCLIEASKKLHNYCLDKCVLYVTLEPCQMCAGALQQAKIKKIVFGAKDYKNGACGGLYDFFFIPKMNYYPLISYLENDECLQIIKEYFIKKRKK